MWNGRMRAGLKKKNRKRREHGKEGRGLEEGDGGGRARIARRGNQETAAGEDGRLVIIQTGRGVSTNLPGRVIMLRKVYRVPCAWP